VESWQPDGQFPRFSSRWKPNAHHAILRLQEFCVGALEVRSVAGAGAFNICCLVRNMAKSRLSMRREVEAAEAAEAGTSKKKATRKTAGEKGEGTTKKRATKGEKEGAAPKKRKAAKPRTKRAKEAMQRRRLIWVVYSSTMREEGRFLYHEKDKADELLATLLGRGKRRYFMQPMKEALNPDGTPVVQSGLAMAVDDVDDDDEVKVEVDAEVADDVDLDVDLDGDEEEVEEAEAEEASPEV
jgi:hypothetical protein